MNKLQKHIKLLEKYTNKKVVLKEGEQLKAMVIAVGVVNMDTGMTGHKWSIYENTGLYAFLTDRGFLLFGNSSTFEIGDDVSLYSNEGRNLSKRTTIVDIAPCIKDELLAMLKKHRYDYYPIRAFKARAKDNRKLSTSYSVKGTVGLNESKKIKLQEKGMPDFLKYDNLFKGHQWEEEEDGGNVITKPAPTKPHEAPKPKPRSPLSPEKPVVTPKPKANLRMNEDDSVKLSKLVKILEKYTNKKVSLKSKSMKDL